MIQKKKAQSSLEFLSIFTIGFSIVIILSSIFFFYYSEQKDNLNKIQVENIAKEITDSIETIYFQSEGNKFPISLTMPEGIESITIHHMNNVTGGLGTPVSYDYLNITYIFNNELYNEVFATKLDYIRFNCTTSCTTNPATNISTFDNSVLTPGLKNIQFESKGDWVNMDFFTYN